MSLIKEENIINIVMFGDSLIEYGEWKELIDTNNNILNRGISGDTTKGLLNRVDSIGTNVKKTFLMIGVNDLFMGVSVDKIFSNYKEIAERLAKKNIKLIIMSTLYTGATYAQYYNKDIEKLNELILNYAKNKNILYLNINSILAKENILEGIYSLDGVHLNYDGYLKWSSFISKYF